MNIPEGWPTEKMTDAGEEEMTLCAPCHYRYRANEIFRAMLSAAPTPTEVEPVAYEIRFVGSLITPMLWLKVPVSEYEEMKDKPEWEGRKLYTSLPSPSKEIAALKSEIEFLTAGFNAAHATCEDLKAELAKIGKAEWDADGNPLNLEAAARDVVDKWNSHCLGHKYYVDNLRKFLGES
jgi:hypothetical protein